MAGYFLIWRAEQGSNFTSCTSLRDEELAFSKGRFSLISLYLVISLHVTNRSSTIQLNTVSIRCYTENTIVLSKHETENSYWLDNQQKLPIYLALCKTKIPLYLEIQIEFTFKVDTS